MSIAGPDEASPPVDAAPVVRRMIEAAVTHAIEAGELSIWLAEALDDIGDEFKRGGERIMHARAAAGMPLPDGPDDVPSAALTVD